MQLAMIGLGRMGANMARRLLRAGHTCTVYDRSPDAVAQLVREGATGVDSLAALVSSLAAPRHVWVMVPAGEPTDRRLQEYMAAGMTELHLYHLALLGQQGLAAMRHVIDTTRTLAAKG